jgi:hypothetical protein
MDHLAVPNVKMTKSITQDTTLCSSKAVTLVSDLDESLSHSIRDHTSTLTDKLQDAYYQINSLN